MTDQINDEGADPSSDIAKQNPDQTTTADLAGEQGTAEGSGDATKTQDLAKAGRDDMDPNAGQE